MTNNFSVIVFTKDRPLQLHAYLESLFRYSPTKQSDVTIIYKKNELIDYHNVINHFRSVKFIEEDIFHADLIYTIENSRDYIIFGCDDVVFTKKFDLNDATTYLASNSNIFGFSLRLGTNILPMPKKVNIKSEVIEWEWINTQAQHYNYPWELTATLYRKIDIKNIIKSHENPFTSPNFLEGDIASNPSKYINRTGLMCYNSESHALIITVNVVQNTHSNPVDESLPTDILTLNSLYNSDGNTLDIEKIVKLKNNTIHVDSRHFILRKKNASFVFPKKSKVNKLAMFYKNLRYLTKFSIKKIANDPRRLSEEEINLLKFRILRKIFTYNPPHILDYDCAIKRLSQTEISLCRFGDGEMELIGGHSIRFQVASEALSKRLKEVLCSNIPSVQIGIGKIYYDFSLKNLFPFVEQFIDNYLSKNEDLFHSFIIPEKEYFPTEITQLYHIYEKYDFDGYFKKIQTIWKNKDTTIICGETVFKKIDNNIFNCARSVEYQYAPSLNAFEAYDTILSEALAINKDRLIIIILGPTATVLAYDLAKHGYRALDFGHIAKDYDAYQKKTARTPQRIAQFFAPD